jgi:topoisomerase-4 subunit A
VFRGDGRCMVIKVQDKVFVGKDIIHCAVFLKNDERQVYNLVYVDGKTGVSYAKRFQVTAVTRDREYDLTQGTPKSKITYFTANDNGEAEIITVNLQAQSKAKVKQFDYNFADLLIKNRSAMGNILTKYPVRKLTLKQAGRSTLGGVDMWFDPIIGRLNRDERGEYLGNFGPTDNIVVIYKDGSYELTNFDLTNHYEPHEVLLVKKFDTKLPITAIYYDAGQKLHFIKRFNIETSSLDKKFLFISDAKNSKLILASTDIRPRLEIVFPKTAQKEQSTEEYLVEEMVDIRGWRAQGNRIPNDKFKEIRWLESLTVPVEEPAHEPAAGGPATGDPATSDPATGDPADSDPSADEPATDDSGQTPDDAANALTENTVNPEEDEANGAADSAEEDDSSDESKSESKPKKEGKKGSDPKSQLGLFE